MADIAYHFRNALGGFHKGDVTGYIEKTAAQHRAELLECEQTISTLREENRSLQQQLNVLMMTAPLTAAPTPTPTPEPAPAPVPSEDPDLMSMELQAYRRAEAVERKANNRARKLYRQMECLCDNTLDEFQTTDSAVKQAIEAIMAQTSSLEQAYQTLSATLSASQKKLASINAVLSDPDADSEEE